MKEKKFFHILSFVFFIVLLCILFYACSINRSNNYAPEKKKYNIILILADDLGRQDISPYGNQFIETPELEKLALNGILFQNGYSAAPLCSPTRASLLTGQNPARLNLTEHLHGYAPPPPTQKLAPPRILTGLPAETLTIPKALKKTGYTSGHFGKWHLGGAASSPIKLGFDYSYAGGAEGLPKSFFYPFFNGKPYEDLINDSKKGDYLDDVITSKAISFIDSVKSGNFFVELNFYAPHVPIEGKPGLVKKYAEKRAKIGFTGLPNNEYAAMVENIDYNVGRVVEYLSKKNLLSNTIIIFTSDNGGLNVEEVPAFAKHTPPTTNNPLRGGKGYIYEGGIRAPWIVWAPSIIKKGKIENGIISSDDLFNTVMDFAMLPERSADGNSFASLIWNKERNVSDYFLHFPHYSPQRGNPGAVIRRGDYKLIEWYESGKVELYNLKVDESESINISSANPQKVAELKYALNKWRARINAKMPSLNTTYREIK